ncbi:MAG: PHB depolymerase family esterase [Rudaea sp.]
MSGWREWLRRATLPNKDPTQHASPGAIGSVITKALVAAGLMKENPTAERGQTATPSRAQTQTARDADRDAQFFWASFEPSATTLAYKIFLPSRYSASSTPVPLIVMLHGCTQDPDDFALGTRMNILAEKHGFIVAYPMQTSRANSSKCWNWFRPEDQHRDRGEPQQIAGVVRDLIAHYRIDPARIYVAGMSAGAAMAVIMGRTYPELFAAVAAHSGLPFRSANNVISALGVMKNSQMDQSQFTRGHEPLNVPTIVFHGDRDATVNHANANHLVAQVIADWPTAAPLSIASTTHLSEGGRECDRVIYKQPDGKIAIEYWTIHGAGHHWTGGDPRGSHSDATGPDASARIVAFFESQRNGKN